MEKKFSLDISSSSMALSKIASFSSSTPQFKYDVFLSFRGEDTRYNFTNHLLKALRDNDIITFIDDELNRGDEISPSLLKAIEESQISIIIFSEHYADSIWCLEEIAKILECKKRYEQIVIPVFYNVCPSDVRNQTGTYGDAFTIHEKRFSQNLEKVQIWKDALKEAANLSGWHPSTIKPESELIENIVKHILERLTDMSSSDDKNLVGIDSKIEHIVSLLATKEVCRVGIWGTGGIGKTTLAEAVFNKIRCHFEGSYFAHNVREDAEQSGGLYSLGQKLYSAVLREKNVDIGTSSGKRRLGRRKLLIVFDDVTDFQQIEDLIGNLDRLSSQSRIIITTRDKQVLNNYGVNYIYEVKELIPNDALDLFCRHGFKHNHPAADYIKLSKGVLLYAGGLPLALKLLGAFLFNKRKEVWESAISKLEKIPDIKIHEVLKISYDGLDDEVQKIFLDIACFFIGSEVGAIKVFLEACGYSADIGINILIDNHLIIQSNNVIKMHDLLQAMGREIVRQESTKDPGKCSRLWYHEDIDQVLRTNTVTGRIEGISLDMSKIDDIYLNHNAFTNMHNLRFLKFYDSSNGYKENRNKVHGFEALDFNFSALRCLSWFKCPLKSLPSRFHLKNLVTLEMHKGTIEQLWNDVQLLHLGELKEVDLSFCLKLTSCAGFSRSPNLEKLVLKYCMTLREIPSSIQNLRKLNFLDLTHCFRLKSLPNLVGLTSLEKLVLSHCSNLKVLPEMPCNIEELHLVGLAIEELPSSIENLSRLVFLNLRSCRKLKSLPNSICKWKSLESLCLSVCERLDKLPNDIGTLKSLRRLWVESSGIKEVPSSIIHLNNLYTLTFRGCKDLLLLPPLTGLNNLVKLDLTDCGVTKIPDTVGSLPSLKVLNLGKRNLESIPASIINLSNLDSLDISFSKSPVEVISIRETNTLEEILQKVAILIGPRYCRFTNCFKLDQNILKDIVTDALPEILPKIQDLASMSKEYRDKEFEDAPTTANICYPSSEIPEWFNIQSSESFITLKLPPDWLNNFVGFTLCAVAALPNYGFQRNMLISCQYSTFKDGQRHVVSEVVIDTPYFVECQYKSKYVIIGFDSRLFPHQIGESLSCSDEVAFQIKVTNMDYSRLRSELLKLPNNVKKCGVRLMYAQRHEGCNRIRHVESVHMWRRKMESEKANEILFDVCAVQNFASSDYYGYMELVGISDIRGDHWKIIFENGWQLKVICEDLSWKWMIDLKTGFSKFSSLIKNYSI